MIVFVDLEHARLREDAALWPVFGARVLVTKYRLEAISGEDCLVMHYARVTPDRLRDLKPRAVVVSGHYTRNDLYAEADLAGLCAVLRDPEWPMLAVCGSFQTLGHVRGCAVGPMESLPGGALTDTPLPPEMRAEGEAPTNHKLERGFMPVRVLQPHPLLEGLPALPVFYQLHSWELKTAPPGFGVLAATDLCAIQAIAHASAPVYGTQFHPELYDEAHPDGRRLLTNFFKLAGVKG